ncbi:hypothetical protein CsatB_023594 [Cannabis sativa]
MFHGGGAVAWEKVCQPKSAGGLGIKKIEEWNKAAMCKYIWAIANKQDSLWLRWIQGVYIKNQEWWSYNASIHASWYWKKVVTLKNQLKSLCNVAEFQRDKYTIAAGYCMFSPTPIKINWCKEVWGRLNTPKHCIILWLAMLNRLKTKDRLLKMGLQIEGSCCLCETQQETSQHLFFECCFSCSRLQEIKCWLGWNATSNSLPMLLRWVQRAKLSKFRKLVYQAAIAALVYAVWKLRNGKIWQGNTLNSSSFCDEIKWNVKMRCNMYLPRKIQEKDRDWFHDL